MSPASDANAGEGGGPCTPVPGSVGTWSFDQTTISGTAVNDQSGSNAHGVMMGPGSLTTTTGRFGNALVFPPSGSAGWVRVSSVALDSSSNAKNSFAFWFYRKSGGNVDDVLFNAPIDPRYDLWFVTRGSDDFLCINTQSNDCWGVRDASLRDRWVHVVAILNNGSITASSLYVDGKKRTPTCHSNAGFAPCDTHRTVATPVVLGGESDYPFRGDMDDFRIYPRALTDAEVLALYEGRVCP